MPTSLQPKFPANREINREFDRFSRVATIFTPREDAKIQRLAVEFPSLLNREFQSVLQGKFFR